MESRGRDAARRRRNALGRFDARQGGAPLCGVDEVGRGPLAGPVVAAAVILGPGVRLPGVDDSKRLTPAVRERLAQAVHEQARAVALGIVDADQIDRLNIRQATFLAMRQALAALAVEPSLVLIDGHETLPELTWPQRPVIGGDRRSLSVAAASVVAKVYRDRLMVDFDERYPGYGFAAHKGYGTAEHVAALTHLGPCPIHRRSFAPVRLLSQGVLL